MCVFCKIASGEIPSNKLYEDDKVLAFYDLDPQAPTHFLVIPKEHIASAAEITPENAGMVAHIFATIARICAERLAAQGMAPTAAQADMVDAVEMVEAVEAEAAEAVEMAEQADGEKEEKTS